MGLKKSKFVADISIPATGTFDFVINGQNFKITIENFKKFLGIGNGLNSPNIRETGISITLLVTDDYIVGTGDITITFPILLNSTKPFTIKNDGIGTITADGNGSSITGSSTMSPGVSRKYLPKAFGWTEIT